ncbi:CBS domain-containing protein [Streptomyces sp. WAC 00631]|uniref:CBS domain-containing protein n=1 Tax=unclassified Streptomyces TaxID=2593676 RepID=UPI000F7944CA|nr:MULTISPECIES: CBS domain-containing protein [unclassified Streptomyces]MCC5033463.1 CBS domain-containing protein [Streptomyces sp. WAC 00631]MCC9741551.1 CBS domain-containing protein [Streptomyces sp. MNU89]
MKQRKVGSVMTDDVVRVVRTTPFKDIAALLDEHRISGVPVVDDDEKVIGVISETDLMARQTEQTDPGERRHRFRLTPAAHRTAAKARARTAGELMSSPAVTVRAESSIAEAARILAKYRVERLPVIDEEDRLVGIVTRRDLLQVFLRPDEEIRAEVIDEVLVRTLWLVPQAVKVTVTDGVVTLEGELERSSEVPVAVRMTGQIDGVVSVVDRLTSRYDDSRLRPAEASTAQGTVEDWLRSL